MSRLETPLRPETQRENPPRSAHRSRWIGTPAGEQDALDRLGVFTARTAQRLHHKRRRENVQKIVLGTTFLALLAAALLAWRLPRTALVRSTLVGRIAPPGAAGVLAGDGVFLFPSGRGLVIFDPASGKSQAVFQGDFALRAAPATLDNAAFVPCDDGVLRAIDWQSGARLWSLPLGAPLGARPAMVPAAKMLVAGNDAGEVFGVAPGRGKLLWRRATRAHVGAGLVAVDGKPWVLTPLLPGRHVPGGLRCLDARSGRTVWNFAGPGQLAPPTVDAERGRVYCADDSGMLRCLRLADGGLVWKIKIAPDEALRGGVTQMGNLLAVGGNDGILRGCDADSGRELWRFHCGSPVLAPPLAVESGSGPALLVPCHNALALLDGDGKLLKTYATRGVVRFPAVAWRDKHFAVNAAGSLYKIRVH